MNSTEATQRACSLEQSIAQWFEMDLAGVATRVRRLPVFAPGSTESTLACLLSETTSERPSLEQIESCFRDLQTRGHLEGQCVATGAAVLTIWSSGTGLERYDRWHGAIETLLAQQDRLQPLAVASLLGFRGLVEMTGRNDLPRATATYEACLAWCLRAGAVSLHIYQSAMLCHCYFWRGEIFRAGALLADTRPLVSNARTSPLASAYFEITRGLQLAMQGDVSAARQIFAAVEDRPEFPQLPPFVALVCLGHHLFALAQGAVFEEIDRIADRIRELVIPEGVAFHHSYLHFCLAIAVNAMGKPARGLVHAQWAIEVGTRSGSEIPSRMPALVVAQSLADLGETEAALRHLKDWIGIWQQSGYLYFVAAGQIEKAALLASRGELDEAREAFNAAARALPRGEEPPHLLRPPSFTEALRRRLFAQASVAITQTDRDRSPVDITTLGEFRIRIGRVQIYDRHWHGDRTRQLLKALVAFGGQKVAQQRLFDELWPDSDADQASSALKVALSRLRRLGTEKGETALPWIVVRHKQVSLPRTLCFVDALMFRDAIQPALRAGNADRLAGVLDLYRGEFLAGENDGTWVLAARDSLRTLYSQGAITLAGLLESADQPDRALTYLVRALDGDTRNEAVAALAMKQYLGLGFPSRAAEVYLRARDALKRDLGVVPGPELQQWWHQATGRP